MTVSDPYCAVTLMVHRIQLKENIQLVSLKTCTQVYLVKRRLIEFFHELVVEATVEKVS